MTTKEFNACLKDIRRGNKRGISCIYNCYYEKLVLLAEIDLKDKMKAEDAASNVIRSILKNAANYKYIRKPDSWMYQAIKNEAINCKRKNMRLIFTDFENAQFSAKVGDPNFKIEFRKAIADCSDRQKTIIVLHFLYGFKYREISKNLGVSVSTIKREIAAGKEKLKYLLNF